MDRLSRTRPMGRPTAEHEDFARAILDEIERAIEARLPTMATVTGQDGGRIKVHLDNEEDPRDEGLPRKLGQKYEVGDRVLVQPSRSGELMVMGTVSTSTGFNAQGVSEDELYDGAVGGKKIAPGAVDWQHIATDAVRSEQLRANAVGNGHVQKDAITEDKIKDGNVTKNKLAKNSVGTDQIEANAVDNPQIKSVNTSKLDGTVADKNLPNYVKPGDLKSYLTSSDLKDYAKTSTVNSALKGVVTDKSKTAYKGKTLTEALRDIDRRLTAVERKANSSSGGNKKKKESTA